MLLFYEWSRPKLLLKWSEHLPLSIPFKLESNNSHPSAGSQSLVVKVKDTFIIWSTANKKDTKMQNDSEKWNTFTSLGPTCFFFYFLTISVWAVLMWYNRNSNYSEEIKKALIRLNIPIDPSSINGGTNLTKLIDKKYFTLRTKTTIFFSVTFLKFWIIVPLFNYRDTFLKFEKCSRIRDKSYEYIYERGSYGDH